MPASYALLIGVNNYNAYEASVDQPQGTSSLQGSLNDVRLWLKLCRDLGYAPENIRVLTTPALPEAELEGAQHGPATSEAIRTGVQWLAEALGGNPEASGILSFSGHGDRTGKGLVLCPTDTTAESDKLLNTVALMHVREIIDKHNAAENLTVALDCCHSGSNAGAHKKALGLRKRAPEQVQAKIKVPLLGKRMYYAAEVGHSAYQATFCGRVHGAFTWAFMTTRDQWSVVDNNGHKQLNISYGDMRQRTRALLQALSFGQVPELRIASSMKDLPLFCLGREAKSSETSRKPTGQRTRIQCDPGCKDYRMYRIGQETKDGKQVRIGEIVVPRSAWDAPDQGQFIPGNEYWYIQNNVDTSNSDSKLIIDWYSYFWSDQPYAPVSGDLSFTMQQAPIWSSTPTPGSSDALFVNNGEDSPFCLDWALTYDARSKTWSGNLTWYDTTGESNVFGGDSTPPVTASANTDPSGSWYSVACSPQPALSAAQVASNTTLTSYDSPQPSIFHMNYGGEVLFQQYSSWWSTTNLTTASHGEPAAYGSASTSISNSFFCLDTRGNVLLYSYRNSCWTFKNLTKELNAPAAANGSALTSFNSPEAVFYLDASGNVQQLYFDGSNWHSYNISQRAGTATPKAAPGSALASYNGPQAVFYLDTSGNVQQLYFDGNSWHSYNISYESGTSTKAVPGSALVAYSNPQQSVVYQDKSGNIQQLYYLNNQWNAYNISSGAGPNTPKATPESPLTYYNDSGQAVIYIDTNDNIQQLYYINGGWSVHNITSSAEAPTAAPRSALTSYSNPPSIFYLDRSGNLQQLNYSDNRWNVYKMA